MANITVSAVTICPGAGHVTITGVVAGNPITRTYLKDDLTQEPEDLEQAVLRRLISAVKEANASTLAQIRNALIGPQFKV